MISTKKRLPAGLVAGAIVLLSSCAKEPAPAPETAKVAYFTVPAASSESARYVGVIRARVESSLGFRIQGKIVERMIDPGDTVKAGQPLMKLDATDYLLALNASRAAVSAAAARQTQAAADEARLRNLLATGAVSKQAYEQIRAEAEVAAAQHNAQQAQARVAEHQAEYAVLRADVDGVVMDVAGDVGQVVPAGQTVVRLAKGGAREAVVNIPEHALALARQPARAALYADSAQSTPVKLRELAANADPVTRTYQARFVLSGPLAQAPLGATISVSVAKPGDGAPATTAIPIAALIDKGRGQDVWVIDSQDSTVRLRSVQVSRLGEETATIAAGVKAGEKVVAYGAHLLKEGQKVELVAPVKVGG